MVRGIRGREWLGEWSGAYEGWVRCIRGGVVGGVVRGIRGRGQEHRREWSGA